VKKIIDKYGLIFLVLTIIIGTTVLIDDEAGIVAWAILSITIVVVIYIAGRIKHQRTVEQLQKERMQSEVVMLKSQLNPHFFFNTLNNLYSISLTTPDRTPEMLLKLADLMRYTIYKGKEDFVTLNDEWDYIKNYIELHQIRFKKQPSIALEENLISGESKIPPLLLIVLVENAFKHGIEKLGEDAFAKIIIRETNDELYFEIVNNYDNTSQIHSGIGLENLKKRLRIQYPKNISNSINSIFFITRLKTQKKVKIILVFAVLFLSKLIALRVLLPLEQFLYHVPILQ